MLCKAKELVLDKQYNKVVQESSTIKPYRTADEEKKSADFVSTNKRNGVRKHTEYYCN